MEKRARPSLLSIADDICMVALALVSAGIIFAEYGYALAPTTVRLLDQIDLCIAFIFLAEFAVRLIIAPRKWHFFEHHWWELLASIPFTSPATQGLRLLRLLRLVRLLRLNTGFNNISDYIERFVEQTRLVYAFIAWLGAIIVATLAFYGFEHSANPEVHTLFDSFWWAIGTVTTDGYGDIHPVTVAGKIVAMLLMVTGVASVGVFTALVASFLIKDGK